jgi:hypothetical protein
MYNLKALHESLRKNKELLEKQDFQDWLNSYYDENLKVYEKCNMICDELIYISKINGYEINNKNKFKNEIASYLYYNNAEC